MISRRAESGTLPGTYDELKRGRKPCGNCDVIIGAGRKKCPVCKQDFGAKVKEEEEISEAPQQRVQVVPGGCQSGAREILIIPSGNAPVKLHSASRDDVLCWMHNIAKDWRSRHESTSLILSVTALEWWARQFFPLHSQDHDRVCAILRSSVAVSTGVA